MVPSCRQLPGNIRFNEGVPDNIDNAHEGTCLVILGNLLHDVYSKQACDLFTRYSHHSNTSVTLITQYLFHQGKFCTDISLNARYIVALKNVKNKKQFIYLANQVYPEDSISLYNVPWMQPFDPTATSSWISHKI